MAAEYFMGQNIDSGGVHERIDLNEQHKRLFQHLYAQLKTTQIMAALNDAGLFHEDWMDFLELMKPTEKK